MNRANDELASEGLKVVAVAARTVHHRGDSLTVEDLESVGNEELAVSVALYSPDCGPFREWVYERLRRAMQTARVTANRRPRAVSLEAIDNSANLVPESAGVQPVEDTLSPDEIARLARVSARTVVKWIDTGLLPGFLKPGSRHRRVRKSVFARFCREHGLPVPGIEQWE